MNNWIDSYGCVKFLKLGVGAGSPRPIGSYNTGEVTSPLRGAVVFVNDFDKIFTHPGPFSFKR